MDDRIHQPYRLKHISGGLSAYKTAKQFGAAALSGAGPSIIAFVPPENAEQAKTEIQSVFEERGMKQEELSQNQAVLVYTVFNWRIIKSGH
jgi:homoserine kinase